MSTTAPSAPTQTVQLWRIQLNPSHRTVCAHLADPHALHRQLMTLLPDNLGPAPRAGAGVLYRVEPFRAGTPVILLAQSRLPLQTAALPAGYAHEVRAGSLDAFLAKLQPGTRMRYRCRLNPTRSLPSPARNQRGKRVAVSTSDLPDWWSATASRYGLHLDSSSTVVTPEDTARSASKNALWASALFEGFADVADPDSLLRGLIDGIGRAKAYGFGLLSLRPA